MKCKNWFSQYFCLSVKGGELLFDIFIYYPVIYLFCYIVRFIVIWVLFPFALIGFLKEKYFEN